MDINIFKRNVSLFKLGIAELDTDEKLLYDFLSEELSDLLYFKTDICTYKRIIFIGQSVNKIIFEYNFVHKDIDCCENFVLKLEAMSIYRRDIRDLIIYALKDSALEIRNIYPTSVMYHRMGNIRLVKIKPDYLSNLLV